jgi:hypothetical protein
MPPQNLPHIHSRRNFLRDCACGVGMMSVAHLLASEGRAAPVDIPASVRSLAPKAPHFLPKAKNVIFLFMDGGPSQLDLLDPKPGLEKWSGEPLPPSVAKDLKMAFAKPNAAVLHSDRSFRPYGESGIEFSDLIPHTASRADDIAVVRSMRTDAFNHPPGQLLLLSGTTLPGRPSVGSWVLYGLGSESRNLPGFVVLSSSRDNKGTFGGPSNWTSGFLPSTYAGVPFRRSGDPVLYLSNPPGVSPELQRHDLNALRRLNELHYVDTGDRAIASRIASYEMAFRLQSAGPELLDVSKEPQSIREMYGIDDDETQAFGTNCLLARRMVERGVRFVMLTHSTWDDHANLKKNLRVNCGMTDKPTGALLEDLKQRGLLDSTLVVWGGEFGRTPVVETRGQTDPEKVGRDHHPLAFSMWLAGGGIRGGQVIGKTDDFCMGVVEDKVHVNDLQATLLHCLGFDHRRLTYHHLGRDFRLTDVAGEVVHKLLA